MAGAQGGQPYDAAATCGQQGSLQAAWLQAKYCRMQTVAEPYTKRKRILTVQYGKAAYCAGGSVMPIVPSSRVRLLLVATSFVYLFMAYEQKLLWSPSVVTEIITAEAVDFCAEQTPIVSAPSRSVEY
jgi:hypothetical protein